MTEPKKKQLRASKTYHNLILKSFIILAGTSTLLTGIFLSSFFLSRMNQNIEEYNTAHLKNVQDEITGIKDFVVQTGYLISQDSLTKKYLHAGRKVDYVEFGQLLERIRSASTVQDYIDSIYLVYPDRNLALTSYGLFSWDTFQDKTWTNALDLTKAISWQGGHPIVTDKLSGVQTAVVTAVFTLSRYYPGTEGYVVVNISESRIYAALEKGDYKNSRFLLLDDARQRITATPSLSAAQQEEISLLITGGSETVYRTETGSYLATLQQDARDGWTYTILTPLSEANATLLQSAAYIALVLGGAILVSCLVSLYLRNLAYLPVRELVIASGTQSPADAAAEGQYDEFRQISHRFHSIVQEKHDIENQMNLMLPAMREQFFQKLLSGQLVREEELEAQLRFLQLSFSGFTSYTVLSVQVEEGESHGQDSPEERLWRSMAAVKTRVEAMRQREPRLLCCLETNSNRLACVLAHRSGENPRDLLHRLLEELTALPEASPVLTVGIGNEAPSLSALQISANQSLDALEQSAIYGKNQVLYFSEIPIRENISYLNPLSYEKALTSAVKTGTPEEIQSILHHADGLLYSNHYNLRMVRQFYLGIVNFISAFDREGADPPSAGGDSLKALADKIYQAESLVEIRQIVEEACLRAASCYQQAGQQKSQAFAEELCGYLEKVYMQDVSLDTVAQEFHFTGAYVNRILKKYKDRTFYDILTEIRIAHAKELLENTELQVYQIAERTGYTNVQSFIRMFKKVTGKTPGSHRKHGE